MTRGDVYEIIEDSPDFSIYNFIMYMYIIQSTKGDRYALKKNISLPLVHITGRHTTETPAYRVKFFVRLVNPWV